ncbi:hypothetical protein D3C71_1619470 [compost metagenome]
MLSGKPTELMMRRANAVISRVGCSSPYVPSERRMGSTRVVVTLIWFSLCAPRRPPLRRLTLIVCQLGYELCAGNLALSPYHCTLSCICVLVDCAPMRRARTMTTMGEIANCSVNPI